MNKKLCHVPLQTIIVAVGFIEWIGGLIISAVLILGLSFYCLKSCLTGSCVKLTYLIQFLHNRSILELMYSLIYAHFLFWQGKKMLYIGKILVLFLYNYQRVPKGDMLIGIKLYHEMQNFCLILHYDKIRPSDNRKQFYIFTVKCV